MSVLKHSETRNPGIEFDPKLIEDLSINRSATERRAQTMVGRRTVKKEWQAAWLLKAVQCMDLTTLSGDDTPGNVHRLCAKARNPISVAILESLGVDQVRVGAVCVYHAHVSDCVKWLQGTDIPVAAVSTGFPAGLTPMETRLREIELSVKAGAEEIDIVISRGHALRGEWFKLYEEVRQYREACGNAHIKTILATGELGSFTNVAKASMVCMMAGADFIKTSTGKESVNATLPVSLVMTRAIRDYLVLTGHKVGYKPAGGIRSAKQAIDYLILMNEELGKDWLTPTRFRFGASALLTDIERQLEHFVTGSYSATSRHSMG